VVCFVFYIFYVVTTNYNFMVKQPKYCYNVDQWPDRSEAIPIVGESLATAYATRVMPGRIDDGVRDMIQSLIDHKMLTKNDSITIFIDEFEHNCDTLYYHPSENLLNVKALSEESKNCIDHVFYEVLKSLNMREDSQPINIVELELDRRKVVLKELIANVIDHSKSNSVQTRANETLLSLDFIRVMSKLLDLNPDVDFYVWIEDDVLVHRHFKDVLLGALEKGYHIVASNDNYHQVIYDYGTLFIGVTYYEIEMLLSRISSTLGFLPLDMQLKLEYFDEILQCVPSCVSHADYKSTIRKPSERWYEYYRAPFPPSGGYPLGNHPISWRIFKDRPNLIVKYFERKIRGIVNHVLNHGFTSGDWRKISKRNLKNCELSAAKVENKDSTQILVKFNNS